MNLPHAGVHCTVVNTERLNHARQVVESLPAEELARFDGIVAVGGDGLFQEALNGLLALRCRPPLALTKEHLHQNRSRC